MSAVRRPARPVALRLSVVGTFYFQIILVGQGISRGYDYVGGDEPGRTTSPLLSVVESLVPGGLPTLGLIYLTAVLLVAGGWAVGPWWAEWAGHTAMAMVYAATGVSASIVAIARLKSGWWDPDPIVVVGCLWSALFIGCAVALRWGTSWPRQTKITRGVVAGIASGFVVYAPLSVLYAADGIRSATALIAAAGFHVLVAGAIGRLAGVQSELQPGEAIR